MGEIRTFRRATVMVLGAVAVGLAVPATASASPSDGSRPVAAPAAASAPAAAPAPAPKVSQLLPVPSPTATVSGANGVPNEDTGGRHVQPMPGPQSGTADGGGLSGLQLTGIGLLLLVSLLLAGVATTTLWWMLHAWRTPDALLATRFAGSGPEGRRRSTGSPDRSFSLIVPARHEEQVLGTTLDMLAQLDHPDFEVLAVVGHDDPGTEAVARSAAERHPDRVRVLVDHSVPKNKPKALNSALTECRGDVTGVFDAEDEVHPLLLRRVDDRFTETGADVVQGGVQLMNVHTSWWALRNVLEYYFWFRSRLHFHADQRFIPLGGNTVFIRTELLRAAGGWDPECLAEDCEIGVRLSTNGARVAVAYDPEVVTREETPGSLGALVKQRTRWDQGFLQVLRKGEWRRLPTRRQRALARYTLAMPFLQAFTGVIIPISLVVMLLVKVPTVVALLTFIPLVPTLVTLAVEAAALDEFARSYGLRAGPRDYVRLVLGTFPYQVVLAAAAVRSVYRQARGVGSWEKTSHAGLHRPPAPQAVAAPGTPVAAAAGAPVTATGMPPAPAVIDLTTVEERRTARQRRDAVAAGARNLSEGMR